MKNKIIVSSLMYLFIQMASGRPSGQEQRQATQWQPSSQAYASNQPSGYEQGNHVADQQTQASFYEGHTGGGYEYPTSYGFSGSGGDAHGQESWPITEHVDVSRPEIIPVYKITQIPIYKPFNIHIPHPILVPVQHPYPIQVPVNKPVAVPVIKEITIPIEKIVPYPVEKKVPYPVEKRVPYTVEKHVTVHVDKPYPVKIPYIKVIYHSAKGHGHSHGWS